MTAGDLNYLASFDAPVTGSNGQGGTITGWAEQCTVWAGIQFLRGGETVQAARLAGRQPVVVRVRAYSVTAQIKPSWRMRVGGVPYNIRAIIPTDDRAFYEITAESGVAE